MLKKDLIILEKARAYWWQIYCRCLQIEKRLKNDSDRNQSVTLNEMKELQLPWRNARQNSKKILWRYLIKCGEKEHIYLKKNKVTGIKISSVWLWAYFGHELLGSETVNRYQIKRWEKDQFTAQEQLEFFYRSSTFYIQLLNKIEPTLLQEGKVRLNLDGLEGINYLQFARSLIFLISEYCHIDINIPRGLDAETCLRKAVLLDAHWYLTKERYRDHTFHVIQVCLLGLFLLNCRLSEDQTLAEFFAALIDNDKNTCKERIIQNWFLAALFHDIGYSLKAEQEIWGNLQQEDSSTTSNQDGRQLGNEEEMLKKLLTIRRRNLAEWELQRARYGINVPIYIITAIEEEKEEIHLLETQLNDWNKNRSSRSLIEQPTERKRDSESEAQHEDHGVRSQKYITRKLKILSKNPDESLKYYGPALEAIKKHNLMNQKIEFAKEPLSFLLILCDELQEWGRPRTNYIDIREAITSKVVFADPTPLSTDKLLKYLFINVKLDYKQKRGAILDHELNFSLTYKDATQEHFQPIAIWLLKSFNFQRVSMSTDEFKVTIAMRNPICRDLRQIASPDISEFSLLRDYMRDARRWQELREWIENKDAIEWEFILEADHETDCAQEENLILHLKEFSERKLLPHNPEKILGELFEWRREYINGARRKM
ncbi:MAG: hypothetical protein KDJ97_02180 [Anaerolineae bacterium]|nr:hypothetical protein [Anaerolineae bacterium]